MVLVTGSMRSGTSSLAGSLKHLGLARAAARGAGLPRNAKGHFEPRWVIEFHKRLLREALVRPSDGSPRAEERVAALLEDGAVEAELRDWLAAAARAADRGQGPARRLAAAALAPRRRAGRPRPAAAHRAPAPGRGGRLAGHHLGPGPAYRRRAPDQGDLQHRRLAQRRAGHRALGSRGAGGRSSGTTTCSTDWRSALAGSPTSSTSACRSTRTRGLDEFLDPGMRRSQLAWDDIVLPDWLRDLAEDTWQQLGALVDDPRGRRRPGPARRDPRGRTTPTTPRRSRSRLDEARHRERRGSPQRVRPRSAAGSRPSGPRRQAGRGPAARRRSEHEAGARPDPRQVAVGEPGRHELVGRPVVLGHRPHRLLGQRGRAR